MSKGPDDGKQSIRQRVNVVWREESILSDTSSRASYSNEMMMTSDLY